MTARALVCLLSALCFIAAIVARELSCRRWNTEAEVVAYGRLSIGLLIASFRLALACA